MTKQESKAISLPYELKCKDSNILKYSRIYKYTGTFYQVDNETKYENIKPILHPLTDLTKEIEHNGDVFIPITRLKLLYEFESDNVCEIRMHINAGWTSSIVELPLDIVLQLISWHFDIAGLIDKGEAIDVNTLDENPYK